MVLVALSLRACECRELFNNTITSSIRKTSLGGSDKEKQQESVIIREMSNLQAAQLCMLLKKDGFAVLIFAQIYNQFCVQ